MKHRKTQCPTDDNKLEAKDIRCTEKAEEESMCSNGAHEDSDEIVQLGLDSCGD